MGSNGAGKLIRQVRDLYGLNQDELGLDARTVRSWENKGFPSRPEPESLQVLKEQLGILEVDLAAANADRPPSLETFALSHPHRSLLWRLRQSIEAGHQVEVVGPPDVLFDKIAECIQAGIESVGEKTVVHIDANQINPMTFEAVRTICAKILGLSQDAQEDDFDFQREATKKNWVLLLRSADVCCSNYYQRIGGNVGVQTVVSRWCSQLDGLKVPCALFNTFRVKDFVKHSLGVDSPREPHLLCYDPKIHCDTWHEWCAGLDATDKFGNLVSASCHSLLDGSPGLLRFAVKELKHGSTPAAILDRVRHYQGLLKNTVEGLVPPFLREEFRKVMAKVVADNPEPLAGALEADIGTMIQNASLRTLWERR